MLIATVAISLLAFNSRELWRFLALEPYKMVRTHQYHPIITSGFVHGGFAHLLINMMTLYFFGPGLEKTVLDGTGSRIPFLIIYFVSLIVGSVYPLIKYKDKPEYVAIGASGAISGIVFAYCMAHPTARFYLFMAIPMPAWVFAILYTGYSVYAMRKVDDNIGHEAHLAGALGGIVAMVASAPSTVTIFQLIGIDFP